LTTNHVHIVETQLLSIAAAPHPLC